jgi:methionyl-tRNA formyltransferase
VSIMRIVPALDAGPVLLQIATPIAADETAGDLQLRLAELGAQALIEALALIEIGSITATRQDESRATYAPKIDRASTHVDWSRPAIEVSRLIRAFDPRPGAFTARDGAVIKLFGATVADGVPDRDGSVPGGTVREVTRDGLTVSCGSGSVVISEVQPAGRPRMTPGDWARGRGIAVGDRLGA